VTSVNADRYQLADRNISRIGYGAMQLAGDGVFGPPRDRDEALAVLRAAVEAGVDHIDTAQFYGPGVVNELIREALYPYLAQFPSSVSGVIGRRTRRFCKRSGLVRCPRQQRAADVWTGSMDSAVNHPHGVGQPTPQALRGPSDVPSRKYGLALVEVSVATLPKG
jgi:hypothetical protein